MRPYRSAVLPLLVALALAAPAARAGADGAPPAGWRFGLGVAGAWQQTWADVDLGQNGIVVDPVDGTAFALPIGDSSFFLGPNGFSVDVAARAWLPARWLGGRPRLAAGYRQPVADIEDDDTAVLLVGAGPFVDSARLELAMQRSATPRLGLDFPVPVAGRKLALGPVLGADFSWFEATLDSGPFLRARETRSDFFGGVAVGAELRVPLLARDHAQLDLTTEATWTRYIGSAQVQSRFRGAVVDDARYRPGSAVAVRFGLLMSLW